MEATNIDDATYDTRRLWDLSDGRDLMVILRDDQHGVSFAPMGLNLRPLWPTACAVGRILTPLRGSHEESHVLLTEDRAFGIFVR